MTNGDLIKILQRFPPEGAVKVRRHGGQHQETTPVDVDRAEMRIDPAPLALQAQNIAWADLVKERISVVLVYGAPQVDEARAPKDPA